MAEKRTRGLETTDTRKKKQQMEVRQIDRRDWAGLVDCLLELVIEKLPLDDCLSFSSVCKPWKSVTIKLFERSSRRIPLLVKPGQTYNITRTCIDVLDITKTLSFDIPMPEYIGSYIWGSYRDWLFILRPFDEDYVHITLLNPFSGEKVVLPKTFYVFHMVVLSSVPSDPRCIYMLVHNWHRVAFWTAGAREWCKWVFVKDFIKGDEKCIDALYHEGYFYLLKSNYGMVILEGISIVNMLNNTDEDKESSIKSQYLPLKGPGSDAKHNYLVESNGDILVVCSRFHDLGIEKYKLDISQMAWVKLESLGNSQVVFLGRSCSRSFNAKELVGGDDAFANKIYVIKKYTNRYNEWVWLPYLVDEYEVDDWAVSSLVKASSPRPHDVGGQYW